MSSRVVITIRGWDQRKAWLDSAAYSRSWLEHRLVMAGMGRREAKHDARQFERRESVSFPPLLAKDQFDLDSIDGLARQLGTVGAIVAVEVVNPTYSPPEKCRPWGVAAVEHAAI
jgi:hypothetical protein